MSISKKFYSIVLAIIAVFALVGCQMPTSFSRTISEAEADLAFIADTIFFTDSDLQVSSNLEFTTSTVWKERITIEWFSSNEDVISTTGEVTRPEFGQGNAEVTVKVVITAEYTKLDDGTFKIGTVSTEKEWTFTVLEAGEILTIEKMLTKANNGELALGDEVTFTGIITAYEVSGEFVNTFVHDGTEGIFVYTSYPDAKIGDEVQVQGKLDAYGGCYQIASGGSVTLISEGNELPAPIKSTISEIVALKQDNKCLGGRTYNVEAKVTHENDGSNDNIVLRDPFTAEGIRIYYKTAYTYVPGAEEFDDYFTFLQQYVGKYVNITITMRDFSYGIDRAALAPYEIVEIAKPELSDEQKATFDVNGLVVSDTATEDFELQTTGEYGTITWEVVSGTGVEIVEGVAKVTRGDEDQVVVLKASVTVGESTATKEFSVTVKQVIKETPVHAGTKEDPFTTRDALIVASALLDGSTTTEYYYVKGEVVSVQEVNTQYGNATFTISDGTNEFLCYRANYLNGEKFTSEDQIKVGDYVVVYGQFTNYKGTLELAAKCYIDSFVEDKPVVGDGTKENPFTVEQIVVEAGKLEQGQVSEVEYYTIGQVVSVKEVNTQYGNATFTISDGTSEFLCFRSKYLNNEKFTSEDQIKVGDTVVICGKITNYNGTLEYNSGCYLVEIIPGTQPEVPHEHVKCEICGLCTAEDCTGAEDEKCAGHEVVEVTYITIAEAKKVTSGTAVAVKGVVIAVGTESLLIQDETGAIMLYKASSQAAFAEAVVGTEVAAEGKYSPYNGLHEVANLTSLTVLGTTKTPVVTELESVDAETLEALQCQLVSVELTYVKGTIAAKSSATFADKNGNEVTLYGDSKWGEVTALELAEGTVVKVQGFVNWYKAPQITNVSHLEYIKVVEQGEPEVPTHEHVKCEICGLCTAEDCTGAEDEKCAGHEVVEPTEPTLVATFDFGENGSASHNDGTEISAGKSYTDGAYALKIDSCSKVYDGARDAKGNSALKLGTSKVVGTLTFTVAEDVKEVVIYVAQYKANGTTVDINGVQTVISTASNNGEYTAIRIDTTEVKTITIATVSGKYRCMIDKVEYYG